MGKSEKKRTQAEEAAPQAQAPGEMLTMQAEITHQDPVRAENACPRCKGTEFFTQQILTSGQKVVRCRKPGCNWQGVL